MGGMQALQWAVAYPESVASCIPIAATTKHSPMQIAFNEVGRLAIMSDPNWNGGDYYGGAGPDSGLAVARMIGHITYLSDESMHEKFGRRLRDKNALGYDFTMDFEVESYLRHQGEVFTRRFDANTYLYVTKALDYFDLAGGHGLLEETFRELPARHALPGDRLQQRLALSAVSVEGDRPGAPGHRIRLLLPGDEILVRARRLLAREQGSHPHGRGTSSRPPPEQRGLRFA